MPYRIYMEWEDGAWVTSLHADFESVVEKETDRQGPPIKVQYRPVE